MQGTLHPVLPDVQTLGSAVVLPVDTSLISSLCPWYGECGAVGT